MGSVLPAQVCITYANGKFEMIGLSKGVFSHQFRNLQETFVFTIDSVGFVFGPYLLRVIQMPIFSHFKVTIENPAYTRLGTLQYSNVGDINAAEGDKIL